MVTFEEVTGAKKPPVKKPRTVKPKIQKEPVFINKELITEEPEFIEKTETVNQITQQVKENFISPVRDSLENDIEVSLKSAQAPISSDAALVDLMARMYIGQEEAVNKFMADEMQKTEITPDMRVILPLIELMANTPFPDIATHLNPEDRNEIMKEMSIPYLNDFKNQYVKYGIPLKRKGRNEEIEVFKAFLSKGSLPIEQEDRRNKGFR